MYRMLLAIVVGLCLGSQSLAQSPDIGLGSGQRGLSFALLQDEKEPPFTAVFACDSKPGFPLGGGGYLDNLTTKILFKETLSPEYRKTLPSNFFIGSPDCCLFSFGPNKAFFFNRLLAIEDGHIRIYPGQTQPEARKVYGLSANQMFIGAFEGRFYWWVKGKPREVFFRADNHTFKFTLHKRVTEPLGMAKGDPEGDLALDTVVIPKGWYPSPRTFEWIILNFKDAKRIN